MSKAVPERPHPDAPQSGGTAQKMVGIATKPMEKAAMAMRKFGKPKVSSQKRCQVYDIVLTRPPLRHSTVSTAQLPACPWRVSELRTCCKGAVPVSLAAQLS